MEKFRTYIQHLHIRVDQDGNIRQVYGDEFVAKMCLNDYALNLYQKDIILSKGNKTVHIAGAKQRIMRIITRYFERTGEYRISMTTLAKHTYKMTRNSQGLKMILNMMRDEGKIEYEMVAGSRATFVKFISKSEQKNDVKIKEEQLPPHKKYKSAWDILDRPGFKPDLSDESKHHVNANTERKASTERITDEEVITTHDGSKIISRDLDEDSEEMTRPPEKFIKEPSQQNDSLEDIPESMPSQHSKEKR